MDGNQQTVMLLQTNLYYVDTKLLESIEALYPKTKTRRFIEVLKDTNDFSLLKRGWFLVFHIGTDDGLCFWRLRHRSANGTNKDEWDVEMTDDTQIHSFLAMYFGGEHDLINSYCPNAVTAMNTTRVTFGEIHVEFSSWLRSGVAGMYSIATVPTTESRITWSFDAIHMTTSKYFACMTDTAKTALRITYTGEVVTPMFLTEYPIIRTNRSPFEEYHKMMLFEDLLRYLHEGEENTDNTDEDDV